MQFFLHNLFFILFVMRGKLIEAVSKIDSDRQCNVKFISSRGIIIAGKIVLRWSNDMIYISRIKFSAAVTRLSMHFQFYH